MTAGWIRNTAALAAGTISRCHAFQTWQGNTWNEAQALARIYHHALPPPANGREHTLAEMSALRPFALIWTEGVDGLEVFRDTAGTDWAPRSSGHLVVCFEQNVPTEDLDDPSKVERDFETFVGLVIGSGDGTEPGLYELSGIPGELPATRIVYRGSARTPQEEIQSIGDAQRAWLDIYWTMG
jgi:hypothetical protein